MSNPDPEVDLISLADATAALAAAGVSYSGDLQQLLTEVSAQIQSYLQRNIPSQSYSITIDGVGGDRVSLINTPITAVSNVSVDGLVISPAATPTSYGFVFSERQVLLRGYRFCRGVQNIAISYTGGYTDIPFDLQRACKEGILAVIGLIGSGDVRATSLKAGNSAITYGDIKSMAKQCLTPNVTSILNSWRRVAPI